MLARAGACFPGSLGQLMTLLTLKGNSEKHDNPGKRGTNSRRHAG